MTSAISCPLWSSVYECQRVECAFTSPVMTECGVCFVCCVLDSVCELFGETIRNVFGCSCYFVVECYGCV